MKLYGVKYVEQIRVDDGQPFWRNYDPKFKSIIVGDQIDALKAAEILKKKFIGQSMELTLLDRTRAPSNHRKCVITDIRITQSVFIRDVHINGLDE